MPSDGFAKAAVALGVRVAQDGALAAHKSLRFHLLIVPLEAVMELAHLQWDCLLGQAHLLQVLVRELRQFEL